MVEMYVDEIYTFLISQSHTNEDRAMFLSDLINPTYKGNNLKHLSGIFGLKFKLVDFLYKHPDKFGVTYNKDSKPIGVYAVIPPPPPPYTLEQDPHLPRPPPLPPAAAGSPVPSAPKFWEGGNKRSKSRTKTNKTRFTAKKTRSKFKSYNKNKKKQASKTKKRKIVS